MIRNLTLTLVIARFLRYLLKRMNHPCSYPAKLSLHHLRFMVNLGYEQEERDVPQAVLIDLDFHLSNIPLSCTHDGKGFMCYDRLSTKLRHAIADKHFHLIEYLAYQLANIVDAWAIQEAKAAEVEHVAFTLRLHKCYVPVPELTGGASFTYTTLPQGLT